MQTKRDRALGLPPFPQYSAEEVDACTHLLVKTGSHLYGLAHADSDNDYWRVVSDPDFAYVVGNREALAKRSKVLQILENGDDVTVIGDKSFHKMLLSGSRMALEVMFAQDPIIDRFPHYRRAYRVSVNAEMIDRYIRSIIDMAYGNEKRRRHAIRLSLNLRTAMAHGRFNPRLTDEEIRIVKEGASSSPLEFIALLDSINHYDVAPRGWNIDEMEAWFNESD